MSTQEDQSKETRKRKPRIKWVVVSGASLCGVSAPGELGLGACLVGKRGLLVKRPERPKLFRTRREAARMVGVTMRAIRTLKGSLIDEHPRLKLLLQSSSFQIKPFKRVSELSKCALAEELFTLGESPKNKT